MDRPDLATDYPDAESRMAHRKSLREAIATWTTDLSTDEVVDSLEGQAPAAPVQDTADIFEDSHVENRDMLVDVEQPGAGRDVTIAGSPIKMSETEPAPGGRAPLLDEHRSEILGEDASEAERGRPAESDD